MAEPGVRIEHPNRRKAASKLTRVVVVLLLLISAALVAIVTVGGWDALQGAKALQIAYIVIYVLLAFFVMRWSRGVLPLAAALALILPVQVLLIAFAMSGFRQAWNVEVERPADEPPPDRRERGGPAPAAA